MDKFGIGDEDGIVLVAGIKVAYPSHTIQVGTVMRYK
ncbi:MAG: hypothetical protein ETSY2_11265 [Candidatus Entotheonella gemina]|uniref:Uncharacterized protein n=1 Tax=Candidatus Entotheonella gemina TaxID=1429439 RepID=W4MB47_9BACT|nr:MAG: hypothetical protein ETSY2_11265 [Candidatus Entotheonella gemina]